MKLHVLPVLVASLLGACEQQPPAQTSQPQQAQLHRTEQPPEPAGENQPAKSTTTASRQKPPQTPLPRQALDLDIPHQALDSSVDDIDQRPAGKKLLPNLIGQAAEKDLEIDADIKLEQDRAVADPRVDGVELNLKSQF